MGNTFPNRRPAQPNYTPSYAFEELVFAACCTKVIGFASELQDGCGGPRADTHAADRIHYQRNKILHPEP